MTRCVSVYEWVCVHLCACAPTHMQAHVCLSVQAYECRCSTCHCVCLSSFPTSARLPNVHHFVFISDCRQNCIMPMNSVSDFFFLILPLVTGNYLANANKPSIAFLSEVAKQKKAPMTLEYYLVERKIWFLDVKPHTGEGQEHCTLG